MSAANEDSRTIIIKDIYSEYNWKQFMPSEISPLQWMILQGQFQAEYMTMRIFRATWRSLANFLEEYSATKYEKNISTE